MGITRQKLYDYGQREDGSRMLGFWCPGCKEPHSYLIERPAGVHPAWTFNGNFDKPSFSPSLLYPSKPIRCHLYVTDGQIIFLSDCQHELAGKTVELQEWP